MIERALQTSAESFAGAAVSLHRVRQVFGGGVVALDGIDLEIAAGEFVAILGPSGCGKSTLLRLIAGLDRPTAGQVRLAAGASAEKDARSGLAYVFQDAHLLPWRSVLQNVALPLELRGMKKADRLEIAERAISRVGLLDAAGRYPNQLSGGMRMRASLARALVTRPRLLLMDEPFASLDEITRQHLDEQLRELWLDRRMTVVFVTHSTAEAVFLADRAVVLSRRPARIMLDRAIELPSSRDALLRTTPEFAGNTRAVYEALARGEA